MSNLLTRDQILAAKDMKTEIVHVPEWGGDVCVRTLSGTERDEFEEGFIGDRLSGDTAMLRREGWKNVRARLVSWVIVDENGGNLFTPEDIDELGKKSAAALDRVFTVAQKLSGLTKQDIKKLAETKEKN